MAKKDYERGQGLISKYVWVVNTIYQAGRITFDELNEKWLDDDISQGKGIPKRTFDHWRDAILDMFGIFIDNEHRGKYRYFIQNEEDINNNGIRSWIYNTYCVTNALASSLGIKDRILLEYVPSGEVYLQPIIDAMKENRVLNITYKSYWKDREKNYDVQPLCLKLFRQRWYVVVTDTEKTWICALDRIRSLQKTEQFFTMPQDWDAEAYFDGFIGLIRDLDHDMERVKLKVEAIQANYIRDLRIHKSQRETERNSEYSIFTYYLRPTFDFQQELLWNADRVEVLEPQWLREEMACIIEEMSQLYKDN